MALAAAVKAMLYSPKRESYFHVNPGRSFAIFEEWICVFFIEETALQLCSLHSPIALFTVSIGIYGLRIGSLVLTWYYPSFLIEFSLILFFFFTFLLSFCHLIVCIYSYLLPVFCGMRRSICHASVWHSKSGHFLIVVMNVGVSLECMYFSDLNHGGVHMFICLTWL